MEPLLTHTSPQSREMEIIKIKNNKEFKEARKELEMDLPKEVSLTSLGYGKYAVDILKRFRMLDCKLIATPMESNLKLLCEDSSYLVDAITYRQMIGSLMH